jgi:hypothetical protein
MTDRQDYGEPWPPQQGYGQQYPQDPWQPQPYDPAAHRQRIGPEQYAPQHRPWPQETPQSPGPPGDFRPYGQPYEQPGYGQPPRETQPGPQHAQPRRKTWPARHKVLTGFIALGSLVAIGGIARAATGTPPKPAANVAAATTAASAPPASPSAAAAPDCATQVQDWGSGTGGQQVSTLGTDVGTLGTTAQTLAADIEAQGTAPASDIAAVQSAAASVQADAQTVEDDPGPACLPGLTSNLTAGAHDYQVAAIDATNGLNQMSAGNYDTATADFDASNTEMTNGTAKIAAATSAVQSLGSGQGA